MILAGLVAAFIVASVFVIREHIAHGDPGFMIVPWFALGIAILLKI